MNLSFAQLARLSKTTSFWNNSHVLFRIDLINLKGIVFAFLFSKVRKNGIKILCVHACPLDGHLQVFYSHLNLISTAVEFNSLNTADGNIKIEVVQ